MRRTHPDVVRAYGGYWPADFGVPYNRLADGVPVVVSVHDTNPYIATPVCALCRFGDLHVNGGAEKSHRNGGLTRLGQEK